MAKGRGTLRSPKKAVNVQVGKGRAVKVAARGVPKKAKAMRRGY